MHPEADGVRPPAVDFNRDDSTGPPVMTRHACAPGPRHTQTHPDARRHTATHTRRWQIVGSHRGHRRDASAIGECARVARHLDHATVPIVPDTCSGATLAVQKESEAVVAGGGLGACPPNDSALHDAGDELAPLHGLAGPSGDWEKAGRRRRDTVADTCSVYCHVHCKRRTRA
jgi:hypothetical protein